MIDFIKRDTQLVMRYVPENRPADWLIRPLESEDEISLSGRVFHVRREIYRPDFDDAEFAMDPCYHFIVGIAENGYYLLDRQFLGIEYDLFLHESLRFKRTTFVAATNIPIFRGFNDYGLPSMYFGGDHPDAIPTVVFEAMLRQFPNTYELKKYARARVSTIIRNYVPVGRDFLAEYDAYMERKPSIQGSSPREEFAEYEAGKFSELVTKIKSMLAASPGAYKESQWQKEILQVILFLYPKYVRAFREAPVRDSWAKTNRKVDFLLVDASGYVDAIEIKRPSDEQLVTPNDYRGNHVPMRDLSGTIMQLEKYLYHLNRWGQTGEDKLNKEFADRLPDGLRIKIVNPSGMIIMGRDDSLTNEQKNDFEVIRRKYRHVVEIMTYDDLLRRLQRIRDQFATDPSS